VNRLFANDSLFLRDVLKIPVDKEMADIYNGQICSGETSVSVTAASSLSTESYSDDDSAANDFLDKIDSAIASTKAQVKHVQRNSK